MGGACYGSGIDTMHDAPDATMAVFLDLENIAIGARDARYPTFSIQKVFERLLLKGHIVVKKAAWVCAMAKTFIWRLCSRNLRTEYLRCALRSDSSRS